MSGSPEMRPTDPITSDDRRDFLTLLVFGQSAAAPLAASVRTAYRDFQRTLHGFGSFPLGQQLSRRAHQWLEAELRALIGAGASGVAGESQQTFDDWHRRTVLSLQGLYADGGFTSFSIGQGQKWVNMSLKYAAVVFGERTLPGIERLVPWLHVPLDNIVLAAPELRDAPRLLSAWSRLDDYDSYFAFQTWFRQAFPDCPPLATEFRLWQAGILAGRSVG